MHKKKKRSKSVVVLTLTNSSCDILTKYFSWCKLIRIIAHCLCFIVNYRNKQRISGKESSTNSRAGPLSHKELEEVHLSSLQMVQE